MLDTIVSVFLETLKDVGFTIPVMFVVYIASNYIISKQRIVKPVDSVRGILTGSLLGLIPQCGVAVGYAQLYGVGLVSISVLMTVFLSSSDEALIIAAGSYDLIFVLKIIVSKIAIGILLGLAVYLVTRKTAQKSEETQEELPHHLEPQSCGTKPYSCCEGVEVSVDEAEAAEPLPSKPFSEILKESARGTVTLTLYVFVAVFLFELLIHYVGLDAIQVFLSHLGPLQPVLTALVGLIPTCASSVFVTEAYMTGVIGFSALISGLCANAGFGLVVLYRTLPLKRAIRVTLLLLALSIAAGEILYVFVR